MFCSKLNARSDKLLFRFDAEFLLPSASFEHQLAG